MKLIKKKKNHRVLKSVGAAFGLIAALGIITSIHDIARYYRISTM